MDSESVGDFSINKMQKQSVDLLQKLDELLETQVYERRRQVIELRDCGCGSRGRFRRLCSCAMVPQKVTATFISWPAKASAFIWPDEHELFAAQEAQFKMMRPRRRVRVGRKLMEHDDDDCGKQVGVKQSLYKMCLDVSVRNCISFHGSRYAQGLIQRDLERHFVRKWTLGTNKEYQSNAASSGSDDDDDPFADNDRRQWVHVPNEASQLRGEILRSPLAFSVDLIEEARGYLKLMREVDACSTLADAEFVARRAFVRAGKFLSLQALCQRDRQHRGVVLVPPLDVMAVWAALLIRNFQYASMCSDEHRDVVMEPPLFVVSADGERVLHGTSKLGAMSLADAKQRTIELYAEHYNDEVLHYNIDDVAALEPPFNEPFDETPHMLVRSTPQWPVHIYLSVDEFIKDRRWLGEYLECMPSVASVDEAIDAPRHVHLPALLAYQRFVALSQKIVGSCTPRSANKISPYISGDQDLFFHVHLLFPLRWGADFARLIGKPIYHDPWPSSEPSNSQTISSLFQQLYSAM
jgi:hypothetical protein